MRKVIVYIPTAGYRPYVQMQEAYQNAKNYLFSVARDLEFREYYCKVFPIHANRNCCVGHSIEGFVEEDGSRWFPDTTIWIDADTVIPYDALYRLLEPDKQIVVGIYRLKRYPFHPLIFDRWKYDEETQMWVYLPNVNHPKAGLFPCDSAGMGCARVDVEVLKALDPPHFQYQTPSKLEGPSYKGRDMFVTHPGIEFLIKWHVYTNTEEAWFWRKVVDAGFEIWADPKINCKHMTEVAVDDEYAERYGGE